MEIDLVEELQMDLDYMKYSTLRRLYEWLIREEYDYQRVEILKHLLEDLHEENK